MPLPTLLLLLTQHPHPSIWPRLLSLPLLLIGEVGEGKTRVGPGANRGPRTCRADPSDPGNNLRGETAANQWDLE